MDQAIESGTYNKPLINHMKEYISNSNDIKLELDNLTYTLAQMKNTFNELHGRTQGQSST